VEAEAVAVVLLLGRFHPAGRVVALGSSQASEVAFADNQERIKRVEATDKGKEVNPDHWSEMSQQADITPTK
jgi:hypothetical protein